MIMISEPAYIIPPIIIAILLLMIVYVGIGRASLLINIVRFDLGRPGHEKETHCLWMVKILWRHGAELFYLCGCAFMYSNIAIPETETNKG